MDAFLTTYLSRFLQKACYGTKHHSVFPTVARVNSSSYSTGSYPATHGLMGNTVYFPEVDKIRGLNTGEASDLNRIDSATHGHLLTTNSSLGQELEKAGQNDDIPYFYASINTYHMEATADLRFEALQLQLPPAPTPMGVYKPCLADGKYLYLSGHGPVLENGSLIIGRIGQNMDQEQGKLAARQVGLALLATIRAFTGSFDKVKRVIKVLGMVNCTPDFMKHPYVINGCSELFAAVWGEDDGIGVRSAVGFGSLPDNIPVEIEALFELK